MGVALIRPTALPTVGLTNLSSLSSVRPYHKRHYTDDVGSVALEVTLDKPAVGGETVAFTLTGDAANIVDYTDITASPLSFTAGQTTKTISFTVVNKAEFFEYVDLIVTLDTPSGLRIDSWRDSALCVLRPTLDPPVVSFDLASSGATVGAGFTIAVSLDAASASDVTLRYDLSGTVDLGEVTIPTSGTITIAAGATTGSINGSTTGSTNPGETLIVTLSHEDGTVIPSLALRMWPSVDKWLEGHAEENYISNSDPENFEMHENVELAREPVFPGIESAWGPGGTVVKGPPGVRAANFIDQEDPSPALNPFTGQPLKIYAYSPAIFSGTPYLRESFGDSYCDGPITLGNPPLAEGNTTKTVLGMNPSPSVGYVPQNIWTDAVFMARDWEHVLSGSFNFSDAGTISGFDSNGWPQPLGTEAAYTLLYWDSNQKGYPAGNYEVTWEGTGTVIFGQGIETGFAVTAVANVTSNSKTITVDPTAGTGIYMRIDTSSAGDPVRNIKVKLPGYATDDRTIFHPDFLARADKFTVLRMMDWGKTNDSALVNWADRADTNYFSQSTSKGVAFEYMLALASETESDLWLCVPHQATDAFVTSLAELVKLLCAPWTRIYLEYSNETWNTIFSQATYALAQANIRALTGSDHDKRVKFQSERSVEVFDLCQAVWSVAGCSVRHTRVMGSWVGNTYTTNLALAHGNGYLKTDMVAIAPYLGGGYGNDIATEALSVDEIHDDLQTDLAAMFNATAAGDNIADHIATVEGYTNAETHTVRLCCYEAGQHLVVIKTAEGGPSWSNEAAMITKFHDVNKAARMETFYDDYIAGWKIFEDAGSGPMCLFEFVTKYETGALYAGSFGVMEDILQASGSAPKWASIEKTFALRAFKIPPSYGNLLEWNRISFYVDLPHGVDKQRGVGVEYAQISLRNRSKSVNHTVTFKLNFPSTVGQVGRDAQPVTVIATSIGNVGEWFTENESGVTAMEYGVVEDEFGVRIWMIHRADGVTLYSATYANVGDVDGDGSSDAVGNWPDRPGYDSGNPILRPGWTDAAVISALGGIQATVGKGIMIYGCQYERSVSSLTGAPGRYRRKPRTWWEPLGLATLATAGTNEHTITLS